jgi:stearoyl-CoA desaturase (delta-9 desaturase)
MAVMPASPSQDPVRPQRDDVQPVLHPRRDNIVTGTVTVLPIIALGVAAWQAWNSWLHWYDLVAFGVLYVLSGLGVTVGFHRHLTHRAFKCGKVLHATLAILGSVAIEGPVTSWVADHRKHHTFSDEEGDPHSPHVGHGGGLAGTLRGLWHAHVGWLFIHDQRALKCRYASDLLADPVIEWVNRRFVLWVAAGLALPMAFGFIFGGIAGAATGLLWGGFVRMLVLHHATYSINSLCHVFGRQAFETRDESRNLAWLSLFTFGEAWHNNHHAFPRSAVHGVGRWQLDISAIVIAGLERVGLVWDVVRVPREQQVARARG